MRWPGIFPARRARSILWAKAPTGARAMAEFSQMLVQVADLVLKRRYRRQLEDGDRTPLAADVQAMYADSIEQQKATVMLAHLLFVRQELGEDAMRQVRDRHALAGSWR
jgi:hypothetical protein